MMNILNFAWLETLAAHHDGNIDELVAFTIY